MLNRLNKIRLRRGLCKGKFEPYDFNWLKKEINLSHLSRYNADAARRITVDWLEEYNSIRPHASLGNNTPYEFSSNLESVYL